MKIDLYTKNGEKSTSAFDLPDDLFTFEINQNLVDKAIKIYLANQRQSNAHTKTRGEVRGGGKKPWRQKGTGRARAGSLRSPIFSGGGVTFGPRNINNYKIRMNKKERKIAFKSALSIQAKNNSIFVFKDFDLGTDKHTQTLDTVLGKAKIDGKVLIILNDVNSDVIRGASNLKRVNTEVINSVSVYDLLNHKNIVLTPEVVDKMTSLWGESKSLKLVKTNKLEVVKQESRQIIKKSDKTKLTLDKKTKELVVKEKDNVNKTKTTKK